MPAARKRPAQSRRRGSQAKRGPSARSGGRCASKRLPRARLLAGECIEVMAELEAESVDAIVTDPPYGIGWQNEYWDSGAIREAAARSGRERLSPSEAFEVWSGLWAAQCARVMKPGAHLLAFGAA